ARAVAVAVRGVPSIRPSSPISSPAPNTPWLAVRRPCTDTSSTWPLSTSHAQSEGSPCRNSTSPANNSRRTAMGALLFAGFPALERKVSRPWVGSTGCGSALAGSGAGVVRGILRRVVQQPAGDAIGPAETVLQRIFATAAADRAVAGVGNHVFLDQLALAPVQVAHGR